jgi:hypothetical protein
MAHPDGGAALFLESKPDGVICNDLPRHTGGLRERLHIRVDRICTEAPTADVAAEAQIPRAATRRGHSSQGLVELLLDPLEARLHAIVAVFGLATSAVDEHCGEDDE